MNIQEQIAELKTSIEEKQAELAELEKPIPEFWEPTNGELAWFLLGDSNTATFAYRWSHMEIVNGVCYQTIELAEQAIALRQAIQRLKKAVHYINKGISYPFMYDVRNHTVTLNKNTLITNCVYAFKSVPNWMYMRDEEACKELLKHHSEDLMTFLNQ